MGQTETFQTELFDCEPLHARITLRQCKLNRQRSRSEFPGQAYHCRTCRQQPQPVAATVTIAEGEKERLTPAGQEWLVKVVSGRKGSSNKPAKPEVLPSTPAIRAVTAPEIEGGGGVPSPPAEKPVTEAKQTPAGIFVDFTGCEDLLDEFVAACAERGFAPGESALDIIYLFVTGQLAVIRKG